MPAFLSRFPKLILTNLTFHFTVFSGKYIVTVIPKFKDVIQKKGVQKMVSFTLSEPKIQSKATCLRSWNISLNQ